MAEFNPAKIGKRLRLLRKHQGLSLAQVAADITERGYMVSPEALQQWEMGQRKRANPKFQEAAARALGWDTFRDMMESTDLDPPKSQSLVNERLRSGIGEPARVEPVSVDGQAFRGPLLRTRVVPVLHTPLPGTELLPVLRQEHVGASVAVGWEDHVDTDRYVAIPEGMSFGRALRAVKVRGSCLEPDIGAGDVVIVDLGRQPVDGEVVVVEHEGETLIKRWWDDGATVELQANRDADSLVVPKDSVLVLGVVISGVYDVPRINRRRRRQRSA